MVSSTAASRTRRTGRPSRCPGCLLARFCGLLTGRGKVEGAFWGDVFGVGGVWGAVQQGGRGQGGRGLGTGDEGLGTRDGETGEWGLGTWGWGWLQVSLWHW